MNIFFEILGDFKTATVITQNDQSYQVETTTGKRLKIKGRDVLLQLGDTNRDTFLSDAQKIAEDIDVDFLWRILDEAECYFVDLAQAYFGDTASLVQQAGLILCLHRSPIYFYKKGHGHYKGAPESAVIAALAGIEKKKAQAKQQEAYIEALKNGCLPEPIRAVIPMLLHHPDKNTIEYKALHAAALACKTSIEHIIVNTKGLPGAHALHRSQFLWEHFPKGIDFPDLSNMSIPNSDLPIAEVEAFSIDDSSTTEIDDAFSVTFLPDHMVKIGIHIAAPALGIAPHDPIDKIAQARMSTVYMPGDKITMLPPAVIEAYSLAEKGTYPVLSLYVTVDQHTRDITSVAHKIEQVFICANLRHNVLDSLVTREALEGMDAGVFPFQKELAQLWQFSQFLEKKRMEKRTLWGLKAETIERTDFLFYVTDNQVSIIPRRRDEPLDKMVAELMIFTNSTWGQLLSDCGVAGIYRSQQIKSGYGGRQPVKMLTYPAPHHQLGVDQYIWATSPLRRYTDLINQWQLIAAIEHGIAAKLATPFQAKDAHLLKVITTFDACYTAYHDFQHKMERYWCIRWLVQHGVMGNEKILTATAIRDDLARLIDIPLTLSITGAPKLTRGASLTLYISHYDEITLDVAGRFVGEGACVSSQETADT